MNDPSTLIRLFDAIVVAYDNPAYYPVFENGELKETFCNRFVNDVTQAMGYDDFIDPMTKQAIMADDIIYVMTNSSRWQEIRCSVSDPEGMKLAMHTVQVWANQGYLTIAGATGATLGSMHGHVCIIRPGVMKPSGKWGDVPVVANCGKENFIGRAKSGVMKGDPVGVNEAFVQLPRFFSRRSDPL